MRAVQLTAFGNPVEGLEYVDIPEPNAPGPNEVLIGVEFSPINPNDLMVAQGIYAFRPPLPTVIGNEGVGRVLAVGPAVKSVKVGDRSWRRLPASPGGSGWSYRQPAFPRCLLTRTRSSWRCWR
jgi:NADPH:quinone reductase-like Zn-dependent oxidoreductase